MTNTELNNAIARTGRLVTIKGQRYVEFELDGQVKYIRA